MAAHASLKVATEGIKNVFLDKQKNMYDNNIKWLKKHGMLSDNLQ